MKDAFIVVREEKHIDDRHLIFLDKEDALEVAQKMVSYWVDKYGTEDYDIDTEVGGDFVFNYDQEDCFWVYVRPIKIRESGEK